MIVSLWYSFLSIIASSPFLCRVKPVVSDGDSARAGTTGAQISLSCPLCLSLQVVSGCITSLRLWGLPAEPTAMPDVKPPLSCDYPSCSSDRPSAGSPLHLFIDMEPCIANLPLSPDPLASFPCHRASVPHFHPGLHGPSYPLMARCNSSTLLTNLGLRYGPSRQGPLRVRPGTYYTAPIKPNSITQDITKSMVQNGSNSYLGW